MEHEEHINMAQALDKERGRNNFPNMVQKSQKYMKKQYEYICNLRKTR